MPLERTLGIIKPDAVEQKLIGKIIIKLEDNKFTLKKLKIIHLSRKEAEGFYAVHKEKPFFEYLVDFMTSGPCIVMVLEKENAIEDYRKLMGSTDPLKAAPGTIRNMFGSTIEHNIVHGSDCTENAKIEIAYFFNQMELM